MVKNRSLRSLIILLMILCLGFATPASANPGLIAQGLVKTISSVFQIPVNILRDSGRVMFPLGILTGTVKGTVMTVAGTLEGALDMARGAAPYAKYALLFI